MNFEELINSIKDKEILVLIKKLLKKYDFKSVLCFLVSLNILISANVANAKSELVTISDDASTSDGNKDDDDVSKDPMQASMLPSVMSPLFSYDDLSIKEKQEYIEETYNVKYIDLVKAFTVPQWGVDYSLANQIKARSDYEEIKELFLDLVEEKYNFVLIKYGLTEEQFEVFDKTLLGEGGEYDYDECYKLANSVDNRIHSSKWVNSVDRWYDKGDGYSLYYQIICPGQYAVYLDGIYKKYKNVFDYIGTYGVIEYLYTRESVTDYMSFYMASNGGNIYHDSLNDKIRIDNPKVLSNEEVEEILEDELRR